MGRWEAVGGKVGGSRWEGGRQSVGRWEAVGGKMGGSRWEDNGPVRPRGNSPSSRSEWPQAALICPELYL